MADYVGGERQTASQDGRWIHLGHGLLVFAMFGAAVAAAIYLGIRIGNYLLAHPDARLEILDVKLTLGTGALAVATLIATLKETLLILGTLPAHLRDPLSRPAFTDMLKLFFTVLGFIVATKAVQIEQEVTPIRVASEPLQVIAAASVAMPEPIVVFPVLFADDGEKKDGAWIKGVEPADARVQAILAAIDPCVDRASQEPIAPSVTLEVVGYASSEEFGSDEALKKAKGIANSNALNVELANKRTSNTYKAVLAKVNTLGLGAAVRVDRAPDWQKFEEMVTARPVLDRIHGTPSGELERWTRRADVRLMRAGNCTRLNILKNVGIIRDAPPTVANPRRGVNSSPPT